MLKKGDKVVMHTCGEAEHYNGKIWTCKTDEFKHHPNHDYTVIMLEGFSGSFHTEFLQLVDLQEQDNKIAGLESSLKIYKEESDLHEQSTYIDNYQYQLSVNEKGEIPCLIKVHGVEHVLGIIEKDARAFVHLFKMHSK
ncbi:hypothetical protein [Bacillus sp. JJ722]|uniref:hypothetical protein n=1 Tax=Bacillus sp. JJ722 TaxID=3122973 RepID=UPI003000D714